MSDVHLQSETFCCPKRTCCDTDRGSVTLDQYFHYVMSWKALKRTVACTQKQNQTLDEKLNTNIFQNIISSTFILATVVSEMDKMGSVNRLHVK